MIPLSRPVLGDEEKRAVADVLDSGMLAQGKRVAAFESAFAAFVGARHAIATSSGTTALHLALLTHGIGAGDEVITSPFSFIASTTAIMMTRAKPVYADISPDTFTIDPDRIGRLATKRTKAILAVDLFGHPADWDAIQDIARRHGIACIADAAQAVGAGVGNTKVGALATTCFSFYGTKNMTTGEGGMVTTDDARVADGIRMMRNHGMRARYEYERLGYNFRMTDIQAAIGSCQLAKLDRLNGARIDNAAFLTERLRGAIRCPAVRAGARHVFHQYTIRIPDRRDRLRDALRARGVECEVFYPEPLHRIRVVSEHGFGGGDDFPETEKACREVLSIPCHPRLSKRELEQVTDGVLGAVEECAVA